ncbi:MAG: sensor histidine kinase [Planctomycetaceae bacterium]
MNGPRRSWWLLFGLGAAAVAAALLWVSAMVLGLERKEAEARGEARYQESLRLAVARMGAFLDQLLAVEQVRPAFEYQPYYSHTKAYSRILAEIEPGEVVTPSPLLGYRTDFIRIHFQLVPRTPPTSPQAPTGNLRDLAEGTVLPGSTVSDNLALLASLAPRLNYDALEAQLPTAAARPPAAASEAVQQEYEKRDWAVKKAKEAALPRLSPGGTQLATPEPLAPIWLDSGELVYVRRVRSGEESALQGFLADGPWLRGALQETIADLFPGAALDAAPGQPFPFSLRAGRATAARASFGTPYRLGLGLLWFTVLSALALIGAALSRSIRYGQDRQRFASSVTHELRTPLTTFQLYSEMLARGMVREEGKRQEYLDTLVEKSHTLSAMVENVLAYARLEEGRAAARHEEMELDALLRRVEPPLAARAAAAGFTLRVEAGDAEARRLRVRLNADAVAQILFNLVDNACKYAQGAAEATLEITARAQEGCLRLQVRDHGPGVPAAAAKSIFTPFSRGGRDAADPIPGLGLGLALSRGLARDLGGELTLDPSPCGALFTLRIPLGERPRAQSSAATP